MHRHPSKRKLLIQRIVVYSAMSVAVLGLVVVLLFVVLGYRLNRAEGRIEQGGLMQFDSRPSGADVMLDGAVLGAKTATKATVGAGVHSVAMSRSGYKTWQKDVVMEPGAVLWLNYTRLIPNELKPENVADLVSVTSSAASPDAKFMAVKEKSDDTAIHLFDISRETVKPATIQIPSNAFTVPAAGKTHAFTIETWDPASRYLLVRHVYNDTMTEWLVVDTENPSQTKNITTLLGVTMSKVVFSNANSAILYVQTDHDIRKIDVGAGTLSRPLISNVAEFSLHERAMLVYTTLLDPATHTRHVGYYEDGAEAPRVIRSFSDEGNVPLRIALDKYFSDYYVSIAYGDVIQVLTGKLPVGEAEFSQLHQVATFTQPGGVDFLTMHTNGRFVIAQKNNIVQTYDLELKKLTTTTLKGNATSQRKLSWLDGYTVWNDQDSMLHLYEFDGANQHDIMPVVPGQGVTVSPDNTFLYGISVSDGKTHLSRVRLILPN